MLRRRTPSTAKAFTSSPRPLAPPHSPYSDPDRTNALWAEMQATLADVELSAAQGTHFFGPAHGTALEELRKAQVALAGAWGRSVAEGEEVDEDGKGAMDGGAKGKAKDGEKGKGSTGAVQAYCLLNRCVPRD